VPPTETRNGTASSRKLLQVLLAFTEQDHTWTVADLAAKLGMPVSTIYRYVSALKDTGLIEDGGRGGYRLTWLTVGLARAAQAASGSLMTVARPVLRRLAASTGETALVIRRVGWSVMCLDRVESSHPVRLQFDPGQPMTLHQGSAARVLLAAMPEAERGRYLDSLPALSATERQRLDADVDVIARNGWVESFGEVDDGIWGTSALIDGQPPVTAAVGIAGPLYRLPEPDRQRVIAEVRDAADEIRRALPPGFAATAPGLGSTIDG